jgi:hypothetical protein
MKIIMIAFSLFLAVAASAQDTTKVEQYCQLVASPRAFTTKVNIDVDYGEERKTFRDTRMKDEEGRLKKFNGIIDALNYMGRNGWVLVNAYPITNGTTQVYHYVLKRTFNKSDELK